MTLQETVLLVDDDDDIRTIIKDRLENLGYHVMTAGNGQEALRAIDSHEPDIMILDLQMPIMYGMEVISRLKDNPQLPIIVLTAFGTIENAVAAMKAGAFDFVTKPFTPDHLDIVIKKALDYRALRRNNLYLQGEIDASFPGIIGESQKIREAMDMAQKVAITSSTVLLLGGSGNRPIRVDIRTIAATNQNLYKNVQEGKFRDDLFFRLNVVTIQLPLLRERKEDIPTLISFFLN